MRFAMSASGEKFTWSGSGASLNDRNLPKKQGHERNTRRADRIIITHPRINHDSGTLDKFTGLRRSLQASSLCQQELSH
jgi:hypothetical protein